MKIILGSSSPRRKKILRNLINEFDVIAPDIDEDIIDFNSPLEFCMNISRQKAESIINNISGTVDNKHMLIICCDTIVTINGEIIGKPSDYNDAIIILKKLNGKKHQVISVVTLAYIKDQTTQFKTESESSYIKFKQLSEVDITEYLNSINYMDKAGAYAMQEHGEKIIVSVEGSITNVIGFPLRLFYKMLQQMNILQHIQFN